MSGIAHYEVCRAQSSRAVRHAEEMIGPNTDAAGLYHLRILLPPTYPMSAPDIMLMTPNGRFELGKKVRHRFL